MRITLLICALLLFVTFTSAQRIDEHSPAQNQGTANPQPPDANAQKEPPSGSTNTPEPKQGNKVTRQLKKALPDCINIIFHTCPGNSVRDQEQQQKEQAQLDRAAQRCEALKAAHPASLPAVPPPTQPQVPAGESSSKSNVPADVNGFQCTPEDVLAAEHDVEVGDFYFGDKSYRSAEMRYRSALERLPGDPTATLHLARALEKQGKKAEAVQLYQEFMKWSPSGKDADDATKAIARLGH